MNPNYSIRALFIIIALLFSCSSDNKYVTEMEYEVIKNVSKYVSKKHQLQEGELLDELAEFHKSYTDKEAIVNKDCRCFSLEELQKIVESPNKGQYLRSIGMKLYNIKPYKKPLELKTINENNELSFGKCKKPIPSKKSGGRGLIGGLISTIVDKEDFRISIKTNNVQHSPVELSFIEVNGNVAGYDELKKEVMTKGTIMDRTPSQLEYIHRVKLDNSTWTFRDTGKHNKKSISIWKRYDG